MAKMRAKGGGGGAAGLVLSGDLRIGEADGLKARLIEAVSGNDTLVIDAGAVASTDTSGLQLLLAAVLAARSQGHEVRWQAVGEVLARDARLLGVADPLGLP